MRNAPAPRIQALLATFLVFGAGLAAAGFVAASSGIPDSLAIPAPHVGDAGVYEEYLVDRSGQEPEITEARPLLRFEWLEPADVWDHVGHLRQADRLSVQEHVYWTDDTGHPRDTVHNKTLYFDPITRDYLGSRTAKAESEETTTAIGLTQQTRTEVRDIILMADPVNGAQPSVPCGVVMEVQGQTFSLSSKVHLSPVCDPGRRLPFAKFRAVGVEDMDGHDAVVFEETRNPGETHVWLSKDIPYALQTTTQDPSEDVQFVRRLVSFERGDAPLAATAEARSPQPDAPSIQWAPWSPLGPDEEGVDDPFLISGAREVALGEDWVKSWVDSRPDAYLGAAYRFNADLGNYMDRYWTLAWTTGDESLWVQVLQRNLADPVASLGVVEPAYFVQESADQWNNAFPTPGHTPTRFPTVASVAARWQAVSDGDLPFDTWGFTTGCRLAQCRGAEASVYAGHSLRPFATANAGPVVYPLPDDPTWESDTYWFEQALVEDSDHGGPMTQHWVHAIGYEWKTGPVALTPLQTAPELPMDPVWSPPGVLGWTGAGALAVLVGLLVRYVPTLVLFSRVQGPRLLEHPARAQIVHTLEASPGMHLHQLAREIDRPRRTTEHHVRKLEDGGLVTVRLQNGYSCIYPARGVDRHVVEALPFLKAEGARALLKAVCRSPGIGLRAAAEKAGLSPATASYHRGRLEAAGLMTRTPTGLVATALGERMLKSAAA